MFKIGLAVFLITYYYCHVMKKSRIYWNWNNYCLFITYQPFLIYTYPDNYHNFEQNFMKI